MKMNNEQKFIIYYNFLYIIKYNGILIDFRTRKKIIFNPYNINYLLSLN